MLKVPRLFTSYNGNKPIGTSELVFDCDPQGKTFAGLRLICKGISVESKPLNFADGKYHHLAVTYDDGHVRFYLDGERVTLDRLRTRLEMRRDFARLGADTPVLIEPAAAVPTEATLQVLGVVLDLGFTSPGFVTELPEQRR